MILTAVYDFAVSPCSYDFIVFLCNAGLAREKAGADGVHVIFVPAETETGFRLDMKPIGKAQREWRRDHLLVPLCSLLPATHTVSPSRKFAAEMPADGPMWPPDYTLEKPKNGYWYPLLKRQYEEMGHLPKFTVPEEAARLIRDWTVGPEPYVTITLRQCYGDARNSNLVEWMRFERWLRGEGITVYVIPDTEHAISEREVGSIAAVNPVIRHALYAGAKMNLGVNNGPLGMCAYTGAPFLMFKMVADYYSTTPAFFDRIGIPVGSQIPWASEKQRMVWEPDDFETIRREFLKVCG